MAKLIKETASGMLIGLANIVPGVSGGTLAVILGIYDRIVSVTKPGALRRELPFLLRLALGMIISILLCSKLFAELFENFKIAPALVFFGMILGSLPMLYELALSHSPRRNGRRRVTAASGIAFLLSFGFMLLLVVLQLAGVAPETELKPSFGVALLMLLAGILAAVSMVLPGVSGSLMMVVIGVYPHIIAALDRLTEFGGEGYGANVLFLLPFGIGCVIGILGGLNGVRVLLEKQPAVTYFVILGLVAGSLFTVLPYAELHFCTELWVGLLLAAAAALLTAKMARAENR